MPALSRIKTVTYSKEGKKCPLFAFNISAQKQVQNCCKGKSISNLDLQPIIQPPVIKNNIILFGGFPFSFGLFLNGGTPVSTEMLLNGGIP
jgi:hypothetical protein